MGTKTILIVDDSEMNRAILNEMLREKFELIETDDGLKALDILQEQRVDLMMLDLVMPGMDGMEVLMDMRRTGKISDVPVIMISAETSPKHISRAYDLGAVDYITRPFDMAVVQKRVENTILLYSKQKALEEMVEQQIYEKEKSNNLMISILSHIVEFRNGESGLHVLHINLLTEILLRAMVIKYDKYSLTEQQISMISMASSLHDIGKIAIPEEILNKPGRFTPEEYEIMKKHSMLGASMLEGLEAYKDEPLLKYAYEITRWHHERHDGRGYPDGLKGDDIPLSAQIVSLADVYDALTSERVYKPAYSHEKAMEMIINGECGVFNPELLECLKGSSIEIQRALEENSIADTTEGRVRGVADEVLSKASEEQL